uniref:Uncharacterized protein n=1 Tax=Manihot esculenta TaxID=3983 RepID=A0A2C9U9M6_MANES
MHLNHSCELYCVLFLAIDLSIFLILLSLWPVLVVCVCSTISVCGC